jgi:DNA-binding transcriptional LysR family regulator
MAGPFLATDAWNIDVDYPAPMSVTLRQLRVAVAVADHLNFRRAAEAVHLSPPAVSAAIAELESALGITLFDRSSRDVRPSAAGEEFLQGAARLLADYDRLISDAARNTQARRGRVTVSCVASLAGRVMPLALTACSAQYPNLDMHVRDDVASQVLLSVRAGEADFGLGVQPEVGCSDITFTAHAQDPFFLLCSREHRLSGSRRISWKDLSGERLILPASGSGTWQIVSDQLVRSRVSLQGKTPVSHVSTVYGMVEAGYGVSVLPATALPAAGHPVLTAVPVHGPRLARTLGIYQRVDRSLSPAAQTAMRLVLEALNGVCGSERNARA